MSVVVIPRALPEGTHTLTSANAGVSWHSLMSTWSMAKQNNKFLGSFSPSTSLV